MSELLGGRPQRTRTVDAAHRPCVATWWWEPESKTAIIESAKVIGLAMLPRGQYHPLQLDTFGLGAVVSAAQKRGAKKIIVGIGGSATNDGGFGLARALGWKFFDQAGEAIESWTALTGLKTIHRPPLHSKSEVIVAVDVQNFLLGPRGATRVYGPQKGLRTKDFPSAERNLQKLVQTLKREIGIDHARKAGAGAAGGLGFGLMSFCDATASPGFEMFAAHAQLSRRLRDVDLVITGEGSIDHSTSMGKGVGQLAQLCRAQKLPCIGLAGQAKRSRQVEKMFQVVLGLTDFHTSAAAHRNPKKHLASLAERAAACWQKS